MRKKLRQNATVSRARMWDELPWKPVNVENENLGEFEDAVFFGLEEIDGNAYKLMKKEGGVLPTPVGESNEGPENTPKKTKKAKKSEEVVTEEVPVADEGASDAEAQPKKSKKDKKRSRDVPSEGETATGVVQVTKKKSKKGAATEHAEEQQIDEAMDVDADPSSGSAQQWGPLPSLKSIYINAPVPVLKEDVQYLREEAEWAPGVKVSSVLSQALKKLGFATPTPIQHAAIPLTTPGSTDIVGAAETGSGKTLAFCLPIIHSLLRNWDTCSNIRIPHALIIAPTRELALQISTVLREVCTAVAELCAQQGPQGQGQKGGASASVAVDGDDDLSAVEAAPAQQNTAGLSKKAKKALLAAQRRNGTSTTSGNKLSPATNVNIQVVSIVGGMSEHKQRRQLAGKGKPVHIVVATPGRLCEMFEDPDNVSFQDMSRLRWLVVDEADRIMEEGHYPELHRVFSRIRDHEEIAERGEDPVTVLKARRTGTFVDDDGELAEAAGLRQSQAAAAGKKGGEAEDALGEEEFVEDLDLGEVEVPMMPSEEEIARMREECAQLGVDEYHKDAHLVDEDNTAEENADGSGKVYHDNVGKRQTLLFSATAIHSHSLSLAVFDKKARAQAKKLKLRGTLKGLNNNASLPDHLKQLLTQVGIQKDIHLVDVTASALGDKAGKGKDKASAGNSADGVVSTGKAVNATSSGHTLPAGLTQEEIHVPTDEKDVYAYYYINKYPGRTLVFVNSIKTARRLDGLLRALGINSRALHAQLQQKQRLHALESFTDLPVGVLVATDVAARGLDIPKIQSVIHYDAARSPQVYVHRSGRTARANQTGTAVSLVSPEDAMHHRVICEYLGLKALPLLPVDLYTLPILRQRVTLAKQIFVQSFVASQKSKDKHWLKQSCKDADLDIDDNLAAELGVRDEEDDIAESLDMDEAQKEAMSKKAIAALKAQLQSLLDAPLPDAHSFNKMQKQRARAEARGGKAPTALAAATATGAAKPRAGRKLNKRVEPVVADNTWKKRSSFFVFAK